MDIPVNAKMSSLGIMRRCLEKGKNIIKRHKYIAEPLRFIKRKIKGAPVNYDRYDGGITFDTDINLDVIMNHADPTTRKRMQSVIDICGYITNKRAL